MASGTLAVIIGAIVFPFLALPIQLNSEPAEISGSTVLPFASLAEDMIGVQTYGVHDQGQQWLGMRNDGLFSDPHAPDSLHIPRLRYPKENTTIFLYSGGLWVGALKDGSPIVSGATDANDGTNEFGPLEFATSEDVADPTVFSVGWLEKTVDLVTSTDQQQRRTLGMFGNGVGKSYLGRGSQGRDDDDDWKAADDINGNGLPSFDFDGIPGHDDDGDGAFDEEVLNGTDDDGDGLIDEDIGRIDSAWVNTNAFNLDYLNDDPERVAVGDANGDGLVAYDPEPGIDEDPGGDISRDYIDNDHDGLFDGADADYDGDMAVGSLDDDGDGFEDEDDRAVAHQELITAYVDNCEACVENPDTDGFVPMGIRVLQHSYQWRSPWADDYILVEFQIANVSTDPLEEVCLGMFVDFDIGTAGEQPSPISEDDITYYLDDLRLAVSADDDGDDGLLDARFVGIRLLDLPDPEASIVYANWSRLVGVPTVMNNVSKYNMLASGARTPDQTTPSDWYLLLGTGPIGTLNPGETTAFFIAVVNGVEEADLIDNAVAAEMQWRSRFCPPSAPDSPDYTTDPLDGSVLIQWRANAEQSVDPLTNTEDFQGYNIWRTPDGELWTLVATYDLADDLGLNSGWPPPQSPDTAYSYELVDSGLLNGALMRYVVTAFDDGDNGDGINSSQNDVRYGGIGVLESSRAQAYQELAVPAEAAQSQGDINNVYVVPNPYVGSSRLEEHGWSGGGGRIEFRGLPAECEIEIWTLAGDLVRELRHNSGLSWESWDVRNDEGDEVAGGIYIYRVSSGGNERIDKFLIVR